MSMQLNKERDELYRYFLSLHFNSEMALQFVDKADEFAREVAVHYLAHIVGTISGGSGKTTPEAYEAFDKWMEEQKIK